MGQKVMPTGFRLGIKIRVGERAKRTVEGWRSNWFAPKKEFAKALIEDQKIRKFIKKEFKVAGIARLDIGRRGEELTVKISAARPGLIIGRKGAKVEQLKSDIEKIVGREVKPPQIVQVEVPELEATLVAESVAEQLEKRASFRRVMKKTLELCEQAGALGAKIMITGRVGGAEMSRREHASVGKIPLQTLRANIDYGFAEAMTTYGTIGVKAWIYKGEILSEEERLKDGSDAQTSQAQKTATR